VQGRGLRDQYPSMSKFARRGVGNFAGSAPLPPCPTPALPGAPEKLAVLEERARLKLSLWHPEDAGVAGGRTHRSSVQCRSSSSSRSRSGRNTSAGICPTRLPRSS
jgi:hypothetical protein